MAFSVEDYQDLMEVLRQHPEWTAQLRELLVGKQLDEANERLTRIEAALDRVDAQIAEQGRLLAALILQVAEQGQQIAEQGRQIAELAGRIGTQGERFEALFRSIDNRLGTVEGWRVETKWIEQGRSYLHGIVKKARLVQIGDLDGLDEALEDGRITRQELLSVGYADALFRGTSRAGTDIIAVVEASKTIDEHDIERATARAAVLRRAGYGAVAVVGGDVIRGEDRVRAQELAVAIFIGGQLEHWPDSAA